jgi:predicted AAA+ superfamily ATPase
LELRQDKWTLFEWYFIGEILKSGEDKDFIKYWNDKNLREVDIVIDKISNISAYELKYKKNQKSDDIIWLNAFEKIYSIRWNLVNLDIQWEYNWIKYILPFV